jgi:hypothetical protein
VIRSSTICTLQIYEDNEIKKNEMDGEHSMHGENMKSLQNFYSETLKGTNHLEDLGIDAKIILKLMLEETVTSVWIGFIWLRTGASGGLLRTRYEYGLLKKTRRSSNFKLSPFLFSPFLSILIVISIIAVPNPPTR